jgi:uncharacterized phage protein gp47/JayE
MTTPTTQQLTDQIFAQLETAFNATLPSLPKSFTRVLSRVLAGVVVLLYKYIAFIALQLFVSTASTATTTLNGRDIIPLVEWGRLVGAGDPTPATRAELLIDITVENQTGALNAGAQLVNTATGVVYSTIGSVLLNAPTVQATVRIRPKRRRRVRQHRQHGTGRSFELR